MIFLDPKVDIAFKKLLDDEAHKNTVISFLSNVFDYMEDEKINELYERTIDRDRVTQSAYDTAIEEGEAKGIAKGEKNTKLMIAKQLLQSTTYTIADIARITQLTEEEVRALKK